MRQPHRVESKYKKSKKKKRRNKFKAMWSFSSAEWNWKAKFFFWIFSLSFSLSLSLSPFSLYLLYIFSCHEAVTMTQFNDIYSKKPALIWKQNKFGNEKINKRAYLFIFSKIKLFFRFPGINRNIFIDIRLPDFSQK